MATFRENYADTVHFFQSLDYGDSFQYIFSTTSLHTDGEIAPGVAPGELYFIDHEDLHVYSSLDSGRTWTQGALMDQHPLTGFYWDFGLKPGWNPGEMILDWRDVGYSGLYQPTTQIYFTNDYGQSWQLTYSIPASAVPETPVELPKNSVSIWPNPTNGWVTLHLDRPSSTPIRLFDLLGRQVMELPPGTGTTRTVNLEPLPSGSYFLQGQGGEAVSVQVIK